MPASFMELGQLVQFKSSLLCSRMQFKVYRFNRSKITHRMFFFCQVRHNIRPYFLVSDTYKCIYDVITWAWTQIAISYTVAPFVLLAVGPSLKFYRYVQYV